MLRQGGLGVFILSTSAMETCVDPWVQLFLEAPACLPAHVAGGFALMLNQLMLGVGGKSDSNCAGLVLPGGAHSPSLSLSPPVLYSFALQSSYAVVKLFFPVLVETRL